MIRISRAADLPAQTDVLVVGAGPAGMAAAIAAAAQGLHVVVADENPGPGGQIYRSITSTPVPAGSIFGTDYWAGMELARRFEASDGIYAPGASVWLASPVGGDRGFEAALSMGRESATLVARRLILATGAIERPFAIPNWTLPGVMTAGAAQIALKSGGLVPDGRIVIAGTGPLVYLLAAQLRAAGANVVAHLDTGVPGNLRAALPHLAEFAGSDLFLKGAGLIARNFLALKRIPGVTSLAADGEARVRAVRYTSGDGGAPATIDCEILLLHHGVIPNINMPNAFGCSQDWDPIQHCWVPAVDAWFAASVPGIAIVGDGAGIGGAGCAPLQGEIAALDAAYLLGRIDAADRDRQAEAPRRRLVRARRGRRFLDELFRPSPAFLAPADPATVVCRCEEITAGEIRKTVAELGVAGPNQLKAFLRCGMGPCQGRMCGPTVVEIIARARGVSPAEIGYYRLRPPVKPVTVAEIASLRSDEGAVRAVVR